MRGARFLPVLVLLAACARTPQADFRSGDAEAAAAGFRSRVERGDSSVLTGYNLGTARLRLGDHPGARATLEAAAQRATAPSLRFAAHFNAGSADLEPAMDAPPDSARRGALRRAVLRYRAALRERPEDADARWNLELAERLLAAPEPPREGGGGGEQPQPGPRGGGGARSATESSAGEGDPGLTRGEADRILSAAEDEERAVQRRRMRAAPEATTAVRDW